MPSPKATILAVALAAAHLSAAFPLDSRASKIASCNSDDDCGPLQVCSHRSPPAGGMSTQVQTCVDKPDMDVDVRSDEPELLEEGSFCQKDTECRGDLKCLTGHSAGGEMTAQVLTCQDEGEMHILPVNTRDEKKEDGGICNEDSECQEGLVCRPDLSTAGKPMIEVLKCQAEMTILPINNRAHTDGIQPEAGSACTGTDDEVSCPNHQVCLPLGETKRFKCQDKKEEDSSCSEEADNCPGEQKCLPVEPANGQMGVQILQCQVPPEGYCETNEDCEGDKTCAKPLVYPEPKSGTCN